MSFSSPIFLLTALLLCQLGFAAENSLATQGVEPVNKPIRIDPSASRSTTSSNEEKQPIPNSGTVKPASQDELITFTPPAGWVMGDASVLPPSVKVMVVGKAHSILPPSINLATEPYQGTLKQYLKTIKKMNDANGNPWKDLGTIRTQAGTASLSQVDFPSKWGDIRMMHVILVRNGHVYILSASSLKSEFPLFYNAFFSSLRSLKIVKDLNINEDYKNEAAAWKELFVQKIEDSLLTDASIIQASHDTTTP